MPIKVQYEIFDTQHKAPLISTMDRAMASIEFQSLIHKGEGLYRLVQTPIADGALTKQEEYLMLVYRVRKLWRQYFDHGRDHEVLKASVEQEKKLDEWNARTEAYMRSHPGYANKMNDQAYSFYVVVSEWRKTWKDRKRYSKQKDYDPQVLAEINKKCRDFEKQIDKYIKDKFKLI